MDDPELEALRQRRMQELQQQAMQQQQQEQQRQQAEMQLIQLAQSGRIPVPVDDEMLRNILGQITPKKREITRERR